MFAGITINDQYFTSTGYNTTLFKATTSIPPSDWLETTFDDSGWATGSPSSACSYSVGVKQGFNQMTPYPDIRPSWLPNCSTYFNEVYFRVVIPPNHGQFPPIVFPLLPTPTQINKSNLGYVYLPEIFTLSFDLTPYGTIPEGGSIIHFTTKGFDSSRAIAIYFVGNTNNLSIRFSCAGIQTRGSQTYSINLDTHT
jgi:hypothetical protein